MKDLKKLDNEHLLDLWKSCVEVYHYSSCSSLEQFENEIGYTKEELYEEILTRMSN